MRAVADGRNDIQCPMFLAGFVVCLNSNSSRDAKLIIAQNKKDVR